MIKLPGWWFWKAWCSIRESFLCFTGEQMLSKYRLWKSWSSSSSSSDQSRNLHFHLQSCWRIVFNSLQTLERSFMVDTPQKQTHVNVSWTIYSFSIRLMLLHQSLLLQHKSKSRQTLSQLNQVVQSAGNSPQGLFVEWLFMRRRFSYDRLLAFMIYSASQLPSKTRKTSQILQNICEEPFNFCKSLLSKHELIVQSTLSRLWVKWRHHDFQKNILLSNRWETNYFWRFFKRRKLRLTKRLTKLLR